METENCTYEDCPKQEVSQASSALTSVDTLSHIELTELFQQSIQQMVTNDPLLNDLNLQVTLDEVDATLDLERGQAMTIIVERATGDPWKVVVSRDASLHQLKMALKHHVTLHLSRQKIFKKISWKYIWRTYDLCFKGEKLINNNQKLLKYGISNKSKLTFMKKIKKSKIGIN